MNEDDTILRGLIEADETYVGGSLSHKHRKERASERYDKTGMEYMTPILGIVQRKGKIVVKVLDKAWGQEIKPLMKKTIDRKSELVTDGIAGYAGLGIYFSEHITLDHSKISFGSRTDIPTRPKVSGRFLSVP